jgi:hypothetical protein
MVKQTIILMIRALIIGVMLNLGIQYVANAGMPHQQTSTQLTQPASNTVLQTSNN